ncbi:gliding motility-associated ABC transporter substrate-binding protein GldG [Aurantibacter sp.]|uniref:gliding motility-associated ABC transporter substrate-binding protein GldG n=1 Tax=Aurantibacter sp. TaxID=2807103 RepID=UPI0035C83240
MFALLKKEFNSFFASPIGYLVIGLFLLLNGLFLWVFKGDFNILDSGFSDLSPFFLLAPWILIFLIPAVTMRCFSDEKKQGTLELLLTKPISKLNIVLGKFLGALVLIILALLPTLLYAYTINQLGSPIGNLDSGSTIGSYFGLLFLVTAYTAIGVFSSTLSDNQIVAFLIAVFICFVFYIGFEGLYDITSIKFVEYLGMSTHFKSMSRGVIDSRDLIYFIAVTVLFIALTVFKLHKEQGKTTNWKQVISITSIFISLCISGKILYKRIDLTSDKRYTLNQAALDITDKADSPLMVDVFLEGENFPSEFKRLQAETRQTLEEFSAYNDNIQFNFINPIEDEATRDANINSLVERGLQPMQITVKENGISTQAVFFPWALASYNDVTVKIPLVKNKLGVSQQELVSNSIQHLEYAFADGFSKLLNPKRKKIAILKGNNQLPDINIADFVNSIKEYYYIAPFTLDSVASNANKTLEDLKNYDLIISAKATEAFSEQEKLVLDQYTMNGGKSLWLIDQVAIDKDSLYNEQGKNVSIARDLNLTDFFFKYGARINPVLISDLYSAQITLASGDGSQAQFQQYPWFYSPLANPDINHPIVNNINYVKFDFANQIDTLKSSGKSVKKTILLHSSPLSKLEGTPREISLETATKQPDPKAYTRQDIPLAVLLEGEFTSVYNNRVKPFQLKKVINKSTPTKMILISDGDIIKNGVSRKGPLELGFDRASGQLYGNKEFLLNAVNYLLDENGLINIRTKEVDIAFLDVKKVTEQKSKWQAVNIILPLLFLTIFGVLFNLIRRKKYSA